MLPKFAKKDPSKAVLFQKWRQYKKHEISDGNFRYMRKNII